jgi:Fis family transcriptional regulator
MEQQAKKLDSLSLVQPNECSSSAVGPIRACVTQALDTYFRQLNGHECDGLYKLVLSEVEVPLLEAVLRHCGGNQTKAAQVLGINRGTLRKKLQQYGLDE